MWSLRWASRSNIFAESTIITVSCLIIANVFWLHALRSTCGIISDCSLPALAIHGHVNPHSLHYYTRCLWRHLTIYMAYAWKSKTLSSPGHCIICVFKLLEIEASRTTCDHLHQDFKLSFSTFDLWHRNDLKCRLKSTSYYVYAFKRCVCVRI